jgi:type IV pilus assembly protein PilA
MKTELKAKFLQHLLGKKKENEGFTLIELLVVIIIIGILSAIALPSFINQAAKAKQTEAKTTISSVNKAQQTQRIENGSFATSITNLSIGLTASSTANYDYNLVAVGTGASATITASAKDKTSLKGYSGGVFISTPTGDAPSIICQTTGVQNTTSADALTPNTATACPANMEILK